MTQTRKEIEEQIKALQAKLDAMPKMKGMTFVPDVGEDFVANEFSVRGYGWNYDVIKRAGNDKGDYSIPCLRPEFAEGQAWVMNMIYKARACDGVVLADDLVDDLVDDQRYYVIRASGDVDDSTYRKDDPYVLDSILPIFKSEKHAINCRDNVLGGVEVVKQIHRVHHGGEYGGV